MNTAKKARVKLVYMIKKQWERFSMYSNRMVIEKSILRASTGKRLANGRSPALTLLALYSGGTSEEYLAKVDWQKRGLISELGFPCFNDPPSTVYLY
jgi:hypothetical protein